MPYDARHHAKLERRNKNAARRFVSCMSDTKWREVFLCVSRHKLRFQVAWVRGSDWDTEGLHAIWESLIDTRGLRDPGVGGPCWYREILWIRLPLAIHDAYGGKVPRRQPIQQLLDDLARLGRLPIRQTHDYVEIRGYQDRAA
jgi:hypothetical protein